MRAVYSQLSITGQRKIERWRHAKVPKDEIARVLKRCRSTIFRKIAKMGGLLARLACVSEWRRPLHCQKLAAIVSVQLAKAIVPQRRFPT